jgi:hypothetical protein
MVGLRGGACAPFPAGSAYSRGAPHPGIGAEGTKTMSHKPPREDKKKALLTPKEKKALKQQKKQAGDVVPLARH